MRALVIDGNEAHRSVLSGLLRRDGFEVSVARTGASGLDLFGATGADLVLLDAVLAGIPGTEVCREMRYRSEVPIIMVTDRDSEIDKVVGFEVGADDYVTKPYSPRELLARVRAVMRRPRRRRRTRRWSPGRSAWTWTGTRCSSTTVPSRCR